MKLLITQVRQKKKTVTENDEVLETARRKSSSSSNSKQKKKTPAEPSSKKNKIVLTRDSLINGISEKSISVNQKVKIVDFSGGTNE